MDDRQMIVKSEDESAAPEGKRWVCCTACQGAGKILVDDVGMVSRPGSVSNGSDGVRRYAPLINSLIVAQTKKEDEAIIPSGQRGLCDVFHVNVERRR